MVYQYSTDNIYCIVPNLRPPTPPLYFTLPPSYIKINTKTSYLEVSGVMKNPILDPW